MKNLIQKIPQNQLPILKEILIEFVSSPGAELNVVCPCETIIYSTTGMKIGKKVQNFLHELHPEDRELFRELWPRLKLNSRFTMYHRFKSTNRYWQWRYYRHYLLMGFCFSVVSPTQVKDFHLSNNRNIFK